ncbi:MAG: cytidylate kinase-like family protein [Clostridia bacterium]|nr:cytidylate kinase-like family protein [Clostridia bacterium]
MARKLIITIARQYGSGGREIGEKLSAALGIPVYDKELITEAANMSELHPDVLHKVDEVAANSLLYTLAMGSNVFGSAMSFGYKMPVNDKLFLLQSDVIREYAAKGSCIIIGRCADYVLRDEPNLFRIFIHGDIDCRKARVAERHPDIKSTQVIDIINKTDKRRASYYNFYTGNKWGKYDNYDLMINSSTLGIDETVTFLAAYAKSMMAE